MMAYKDPKMLRQELAIRSILNRCSCHEDFYEQLICALGAIITIRRTNKPVEEETLGAYHFIALYAHTRKNNTFANNWYVLKSQLEAQFAVMAAGNYFMTFEEGKKYLEETRGET